MNVRSLVATLAVALPTLASAQVAFIEGPSQAQIAEWVRSAYPALQGSTTLPEQFHFAFLVTPDFKPLAHSAIVRSGPRPLLEDMQNVFSAAALAAPISGGIAHVWTHGTGGYGVMWLVVPATN